jgi:hypothetical protein
MIERRQPVTQAWADYLTGGTQEGHGGPDQRQAVMPKVVNLSERSSRARRAEPLRA